jgi:hypothetical protein
MARLQLIDAYVASLRTRVQWRPDVEALVAEVADHLYTTVERLEMDGIDEESAQRAALERFGDPDLVARAYAVAPTGGLAVPTRSTRTAGTFAIASAALWLAVLCAWWLAGTIDPSWELRSTASTAMYAFGAAALLGAAGLQVAAMVGLDRRHGGLGTFGGAGIAVAGAAFVGCLAAWVFVGWATLMAVGTLLFAIAIWRRDMAPRVPTLAFGGGLAAGAIVWAVLRDRAGQIDLGGLWGSDWLENEIGLTFGVVILAIGLLGLGRWLRSEEPAFIDASDHGFPA